MTASTTPSHWPRPTWASPWGTGADVAIECWLHPGQGDLTGIVRARKPPLPPCNIRQNLFFALVLTPRGC